ncbi:MAG TPA: glycosyltransferase [Solirubrobacterales bacterium]|nr:glycosyltransferase [Solirubrobacterales bacterium]
MSADRGSGRPAVSVVVPFAGDREGAERLASNLERLDLRAGDETIVADNTRGGMPSAALPASAQVVRAAAERSAYHARNAGAREAVNDWILFCDADCRPVPGLLAAYFGRPPPGDCGALAGAVVGEPAQRGLITRYARARGFLNMAGGNAGPGWRIAIGGNVLVRRVAFERVGGFVEGIRSGGDVDLSRRLIAAGWTIEERPAALVEHRHRKRLVSFLATIARYAAGSRWLNHRYPGHSPRWPLTRQLALSARDAVVLTLRGDREEGTFRALDGLGLIAHNVGYLSGNGARSG